MKNINILIVILLIASVFTGCTPKPKYEIGESVGNNLSKEEQKIVEEFEKKMKAENEAYLAEKNGEEKQEEKEEVKEEKPLTKGTLVGAGNQGVSILDFGKDEEGKVYVDFIVETFGEAVGEYQEQIRFGNMNIKINEIETSTLSGHWHSVYNNHTNALVGTKQIQRLVYDEEINEEIKNIEVKILDNSSMVPITTGKDTISLDGEMPKIGKPYNIGEEIVVKSSEYGELSLVIDGIKKFEECKTQNLGYIDRQGVIDMYVKYEGFEPQVYELDYTYENISYSSIIRLYANLFNIIDDKGFYAESSMLTQIEFPDSVNKGEKASGKLFFVTLDKTDKILLRVNAPNSDEYSEDFVIDLSNL